MLLRVEISGRYIHPNSPGEPAWEGRTWPIYGPEIIFTFTWPRATMDSIAESKTLSHVSSGILPLPFRLPVEAKYIPASSGRCRRAG